MNPDVPDLPGPPAPAETGVQASQQHSPEGPAEPSPTSEEESSEPAPETAPHHGRPVHVEARGIPAMPAMPGEPSPDDGFDDDDDLDIPEEVTYEEIIRTTDSRPHGGRRPILEELVQGTVVSRRHDGVFVDIGQKAEAFLPFEPSREDGEQPGVGESIEVVVTGRSRQGYLQLSSLKTQRPGGWIHLEAAFNNGKPVLGKVISTTKGGLAVDVGVRAFMPASRSGERTPQGLEGLVGKEVQALIVQLDRADRNVVLDRRAVLMEERKKGRAAAIASLTVGQVVTGTVRNLRNFGAFVDLGGIDGLLHVSDIAWRHVNDPSEELSVGQQLEVKILKVDRALQRVGVGLKQLQPEPWSTVNDRLAVDQVVEGRVTKLKHFGAFVEVLPDVEGLVHISDLAYSRRIRHPEDILSVGETVKVLVKNVDAKRRRIGLSLKEALGDPWERIREEHPVNSTTVGTVRKILHFGAFIGIKDGVDGLLHISDITSERRLHSPAEVLREGQQVRVKILEIDTVRRRLKVGMKQLEPTERELALAQVTAGEMVTGRVLSVDGSRVTVEIGDGLTGVCTVATGSADRREVNLGRSSDLGSLKTMLESAWQAPGGQRPSPGAYEGPTAPILEPLTPGSIHSFRVKTVDIASGTVELTRE